MHRSAFGAAIARLQMIDDPDSWEIDTRLSIIHLINLKHSEESRARIPEADAHLREG
jgi:hypothetical protein